MTDSFERRVADLVERLALVVEGESQALSLAALMVMVVALLESNPHEQPREVLIAIPLLADMVDQLGAAHATSRRES